jgi:hypothetical protein
MALELDRERIQRIVHEIGEKLEGDWLLVGGALVALWLEPGRTTEDVDLVGIRHDEGDARLALLGLADDLGLPVEALNSAADYFVQRIPNWEEKIELLHGGSMGRIFRPSPTLFLLLKVRRLSEQDLSDCLHLLQEVENEKMPLDTGRVLAALDELEDTGDDALRQRRLQLRSALSS